MILSGILSDDNSWIIFWINSRHKMQIFYAPDISDDIYILDEKESRHSVRVLRLKKGDPAGIIDGKGNLYQGTIIDPDVKHCSVRILNKIENYEKRNYSLHIAISPLRNPGRLEWFTEKCVEIGTDEITPLICTNTEKHSIKKDRLQNLIISAMKQSLKAKLTKLNDPSGFNDFISMKRKGKLIIAHCNSRFSRDSIKDVYGKGEDAVILIGPEGDFSEEEILAATERDYCPVHLGPSRLRTETAGIAACHSVYLINQ